MNMSPMAWAHIAEEFAYNPESVFSLEECFTMSLCAGGSTFCLGFSAGIAAQVHYVRYLPRSVRAMLLLPTAVGVGSACIMYRHSTNSCMKQWTAAGGTTMQTPTE